MLKVKIMKIKRITGPLELKALFEFRYSVLVNELNWLSSSGFELCDKFDDQGYNYAAFDDDDRIIGSIRIVPDNPLGLPLERLFSLEHFRTHCHIVEICRLSIAREHRSSKLFLFLLTAGYQCAYLTGSTHMVLDTYLDEEPIYRHLGFNRISEPYPDDSYARDSLVVTMSLSLEEFIAKLKTGKPKIFQIFTQPNKNIEHGNIQQLQHLQTESTVY